MISFRYFAIACLSTIAACDSSQQSFNAGSTSSTTVSSPVSTAPTRTLATPSAKAGADWTVSPFGPTPDTEHYAAGTASISQEDPTQTHRAEDNPVERPVTVIAYSNLVSVKTHDYPGNSSEYATNTVPGRPAIGPRPGDLVGGR